MRLKLPEPKQGDLRWCGMCAKLERYEGESWGAAHFDDLKDTLTTPIPRQSPNKEETGGREG